MQHIVHTAVNTATAPSGPMGGQQSVTAPSINGSGTSPNVQALYQDQVYRVKVSPHLSWQGPLQPH